MAVTPHATPSLHRCGPLWIAPSRPTSSHRIRASLLAFAAIGTIDLTSADPLGGQTWKLSAQPTVVIGADGDTAAQFTHVMAVARFTNGEIAVLNALPFDIRLFSPAGKFVRRLARPGAGPGELGMVWWASRSGDSLLTYAMDQARITVFDVPRSKVATIPFVPTKVPGRMLVIGRLANGSWLAATWPPSLSRHPDGPYRDTTIVGFWRSGVEGMRTVGTFPNLAFFADNGGTEFDLLTANTAFLVVGNELWVGTPEIRTITVYDATAKLVRQIRIPLEPARFDAAELRRVRDRRLSSVKRPADSARTSAMFAASKRPLGGPTFSRLLLGSDGRIWVEAFRLDRASSTEYVALDRTGRVVGRLTSPPGVRFSDIGADYALGVRKDENDVEIVELYTIVR
jgi:hypothetical protein